MTRRLLLLAMLLLSAAHLVGTSAFARVVTRFPALALLQGLVVGQATTGLFKILAFRADALDGTFFMNMAMTS